jgi:hydrogenase maturation factor
MKLERIIKEIHRIAKELGREVNLMEVCGI